MLDQFTRMRMQDEVLRIWQACRTTMVLVTDDIDEAIYMSTRIAVMTPRPGRIERIIDVPLDGLDCATIRAFCNFGRRSRKRFLLREMRRRQAKDPLMPTN